MAKKIFGKADIGCYADNTYGEDHRRQVIIGLLQDIGKGKRLIKELEKTASDDYGEETEAIEILQSVTEDGYCWEMSDGDLMLIDAENCE
jgi:hypothetical protein